MMQPNVPTPGASGDHQIKVLLSSLPAGTKEGDDLELTVTGIDQTSGIAFLSHEGGGEDPGESPDDSKTDESGDGSDTSDKPVDTSVLLGPMNGLKNYLVQKSMDVPKNQGR